MSGFLDILSSDNTDVTRLSFTVNTAAAQVAVAGAGAAPGLVMGLAPGFPDNAFYEPRDKFIIKKIWFSSPHSFVQAADGPFNIGLSYVQGASVLPIAELASQNGVLIMPDICEGLTFPPDGLFIDPALSSVDATQRFRFFLTIFNALNLSMAGVPPILNALVLQSQIHMQILHTRESSDVP